MKKYSVFGHFFILFGLVFANQLLKDIIIYNKDFLLSNYKVINFDYQTSNLHGVLPDGNGELIIGLNQYKLSLKNQLYHSKNNPVNENDNEPIKDNLFENSNVEGFTNMGEHYVRPGDCPDGYFWCTKSNKCKQVCMNCKYNERTHGRSKEFNEFDPCFPNRGVYNGITNKGLTKCTCGKNNQYCNEIFDAQGGMFVDKVYIMNVGDFGNLGDLAAY